MKEMFSRIRAFAFDVDGVMTDGGILANNEGDLFRTFDAKDAFGLRMAAMNGYILCAITGGRDISILKRLMICGFKEEDIYLGSRIKIRDFEDLCCRHNLQPEEVMYFGDDIPDIPVLKACGCGVCPCDAVDEAKEAADFISDRPGGKLCVRNTIELVMKQHGKWEVDFDKYHKMF
jgi:3-deoxy-D-manno-octulosonate 8-phosphate phosphatase (KDO 8-P phosphatase)